MRKILFALVMLSLTSCSTAEVDYDKPNDSSRVKRVVRFIYDSRTLPKVVRYVDSLIKPGDTTLINGFNAIVIK